MAGLKIYILVGDISYNRGDLGSIYSQIAQIKKLYPDAEITLATLRPELHQGWLDAKIIKQSVLINLRQIKEIRKADIIIWGGGAFMADHSCKMQIPYWFMLIFIIRFILRKHIIAVSHGVVLKTRLGKSLARMIYGWVDAIGIRDKGSYDAVKALGIKTPVTLTGDYAMLLKPAASLEHELEGQGDAVCITLTFWHLYNSEKDILPYLFRKKLGFYKERYATEWQKLKAGLARLADRIIEEHGCCVRFVPRYPNNVWDDAKHLHDIRALSKYPEKIFLLLDDNIHPAQYPLVLAAHRSVIAMPLHDCIFAAEAGAPFIALPYETKVWDFMQAVGAESECIGWEELFSDAGVEKIVQLAANAKKLPSAGFEKLQKDTMKNIVLLKNAVARMGKV